MKFNGEMGRDASNYRLHGWGRRHDNQEDGNPGWWQNDSQEESMARSDPRCDQDKYLLSQEDMLAIRTDS